MLSFEEFYEKLCPKVRVAIFEPLPQCLCIIRIRNLVLNKKCCWLPIYLCQTTCHSPQKCDIFRDKIYRIYFNSYTRCGNDTCIFKSRSMFPFNKILAIITITITILIYIIIKDHI